MKYRIILIFLLSSAISFAAEYYVPMSKPNWKINRAEVKFSNGVEITKKQFTAKGVSSLSAKLQNLSLSGTVMVEAEVSGVNLNPSGKRKNICIFKLFSKTGFVGKTYKFHGNVSGTFNSKLIRFPAVIPENSSNRLSIGLRDAYGKILFRKIRIFNIHNPIRLNRVVNMGFFDKIEGDGKGGWSDQGVGNDGAGFNYKCESFKNIPFTIIDPAKNKGKSIVSFYSATKFPKGVKKVELKTNVYGKFIYLLHTAAWGNKKWKGKIIINGIKGKTQTFDVKYGQDVRDHWNPTNIKNATVVAKWNNAGGNHNGVYLSKFKIPGDFGAIRSIKFQSADQKLIWIIVACTISYADINIDNSTPKGFKIVPGTKWKLLKRSASPCVLPGSALDLSNLTDGKMERIIINKSGRLAFISNPNLPVRFFCTSTAEISLKPMRPAGLFLAESGFKTKADIDQLVNEFHRAGYNMYKLNFPPSMLAIKNGKAHFDSQMTDLVDYFIFKCKQNGIFIMLNMMLGNNAFTGTSPWCGRGIRESRKLFRMFNLIFDENERKLWKTAATAFLKHKNPYTNTTYAKDPVLAVITCFNEQEFAFILGGPKAKNFNWNKALPAWRKFTNNPNALMFSPADWDKKDKTGIKINKFIRRKWLDMYKFYKKTLNKIGYEGISTLWDMTKSMHYNSLRTELDLVTIHNYHAHAKGNPKRTKISQGSDIASSAALMRYSISTRIADKPFFVNEYAAVFWNKFRYEESYSFVAYAAFQGFDGIMRHNHTIHSKPGKFIFPWMPFYDPIARSQQTTAAFLYKRGDVREGKNGVRAVFDNEQVARSSQHNECISSDQNKLSLSVKFALEKQQTPMLQCQDLRIPALAGGKVLNRAWESKVIDNNNFAEGYLNWIKLLRQKRFIPKNNRTKGYFQHETSTGELYLDSINSYMSVNTPRFQGFCSLAGGKAKLRNTVLENISANGSLSVISLKDSCSINKSKHLLIVYATNALNSNMIFDDESMEAGSWGYGPTLVETGKFRVRLKNRNASKLKVWPLMMNGKRLKRIKTQTEKDELIISVDTSKLPDGPSLYFEIATD